MAVSKQSEDLINSKHVTIKDDMKLELNNNGITVRDKKEKIIGISDNDSFELKGLQNLCLIGENVKDTFI